MLRLRRGFTLLEMLAAVALVGLLVMMAYGALRSGSRAATSGEQYIEILNRVRVTQELMRHQMMRGLAIPMAFEDGTGVVFVGGRERVRFVGPMPGYLGSGGAQVQEFWLERGERGLALKFQHYVLDPTNEEGPQYVDNESSEPVTLIEHIESAQFSFLQAPDLDNDSPEWREEWEVADDIPWMIRLELEFDSSVPLQWPTFSVAPRVESINRLNRASNFSRSSERGRRQ